MANFEQEGFSKVSDGKGKWEVVYGGISEKIKYTNENFINAANTIGYCKLLRQDGITAHLFISKAGDQEIVTSTGAQAKKLELGNTLLNSIDPKSDFNLHLQSHLQCLEGKSPLADKKYLEKQLKELPDKVYELAKQAVLKSMGM